MNIIIVYGWSNGTQVSIYYENEGRERQLRGEAHKRIMAEEDTQLGTLWWDKFEGRNQKLLLYVSEATSARWAIKLVDTHLLALHKRWVAAAEGHGFKLGAQHLIVSSASTIQQKDDDAIIKIQI